MSNKIHIMCFTVDNFTINKRFIDRTQYALHCGNLNTMQKEMMIIDGHQRIVVIDATFGTNENKVLQSLTCSETRFVFTISIANVVQINFYLYLVVFLFLFYTMMMFDEWHNNILVAYCITLLPKKKELTPCTCALNDHIHQNSPNWLPIVFILIV